LPIGRQSVSLPVLAVHSGEAEFRAFASFPLKFPILTSFNKITN
jgi:hypothetical protein